MLQLRKQEQNTGYFVKIQLGNIVKLRRKAHKYDMFDRLYFPEKMVAILGVVIAVTGLIALGTGAGGMSEFLDSSSKSTIIALSVLTGFFALVVGVTSFLGGFLGSVLLFYAQPLTKSQLG